MVKRKRMSEGKKNIIAALLQEYDIQSAEKNRFAASTEKQHLVFHRIVTAHLNPKS